MQLGQVLGKEVQEVMFMTFPKKEKKEERCTKKQIFFYFNFFFLNIRGLSNFKKRRAVFTWCRNGCRKQKASIIFLQETHSTIDKEKQWTKAEWGAPIEFAHGSSNARGVAVLLRNSFDCKRKRRIVDPMGRYIGIKAVG